MTQASITGTAVAGTGISVLGTAVQTNEIIQWISLAITIIGAIISLIVIPILTWVKENKGKDTTIEDVIELLEDVKNGGDEVKKIIEKEDDEDGSENK